MYCEFPEFGRCCFCLPLRRGVLTFGYLNILFSAFIVGVYSYWINEGLNLMYHGAVSSDAATEVCIFMYCLEIVFNCVLLYGAHTKTVLYIKIYYYYTILTIVTTLVIEIVELVNNIRPYMVVESLILTFAGLLLQLYLFILVRSLLKKLEMSSPHVYENQLHQIVTGERKIEGNSIYSQNTVVPNEEV